MSSHETFKILNIPMKVCRPAGSGPQAGLWGPLP